MSPQRPLSKPLTRPVRLGVLISGGGTTLLNFLDCIADGTLEAEIPLVISSQAECRGVERARAAGLNVQVLPRSRYRDVTEYSDAVFGELAQCEVDLVTMAGFLCLLRIPSGFEHRVMNIHPSLIPAFCGHGYYGHKVHEAAIERGVRVSGCTVHFADNQYDHGPIILQRVVDVPQDATPEGLAALVFEAEKQAYPEAIRLFATARLEVQSRRVTIAPAS